VSAFLCLFQRRPSTCVSPVCDFIVLLLSMNNVARFKINKWMNVKRWMLVTFRTRRSIYRLMWNRCRDAVNRLKEQLLALLRNVVSTSASVDERITDYFHHHQPQQQQQQELSIITQPPRNTQPADLGTWLQRPCQRAYRSFAIKTSLLLQNAPPIPPFNDLLNILSQKKNRLGNRMFRKCPNHLRN